MQQKDQGLADLMAQASKMQKDINPNKHKINPTKPSVEDIIKSSSKKEEVKATGKGYDISKFKGREWLKVTPFLGRVFGAGTANLMQGELDTGLMVLFSELEEGVLENVVEILLTQVKNQDEPVTIEDFDDDPYAMLELCVQVIKVNYEKVFTKGMKDLAQALAHVTQAAQTL